MKTRQIVLWGAAAVGAWWFAGSTAWAAIGGSYAMLTFSPAVLIKRFTNQIAEILSVADGWGQDTGNQIVVTSIDNGAHGATTLHGQSLAVDLGVPGNDRVKLQSLLAYCRQWMPAGYQVIDEITSGGDNHVHVEYDPRGLAGG